MGVARGLAAGGVFTAAAVGLAFHAAAEPPTGRYTAMSLDEVTGMEVPGMTSTLTFQTCGSNCTQVDSATGAFELHLQDGAWTGTSQSASGKSCTNTVSARLVWTRECAGTVAHAQLRKSG